MKYHLLKQLLKNLTAALAAFSLLSGSGTAYCADITWSGATKITEAASLSSAEYSSTAEDQNALLIETLSGTEVTITDPTVTKSGGTSNSDTYSFYGINSAVMCMGGGTTTIKGGTVTTSASGANGVFSYGANNGRTNAEGDGTTVNISDTVIKTTGDGSGGIMTTFGGTTNAENLTIETEGRSSAAIRTDRGGGYVSVNGGSYTSNGLGSPAIYSTADVDVSNATLTSNKSEGVCIEGNGSIELTDCTLTANNTDRNGNAQYYDTIMIYQSMSGDATGTGSEFSMTGGSLNSKNGHVFHVTNTSATINLNDVDINNEDSDGVLLSVVNDGWSGNYNKAEINASSQVLKGDIIVSSAASSKSDSTSSLTLNLKDGSTFTGKIDDGNNGSDFNKVIVYIEKGSTWTLTGDSYVTEITGEGTINENGYTLTTGCGANKEEESSGGNGAPDMPPGEGNGAPDMPPGEGNGKRPELPSGDKSGERPELPADTGNGERPELPPEMNNTMTPGNTEVSSNKAVVKQKIDVSSFFSDDTVKYRAFPKGSAKVNYSGLVKIKKDGEITIKGYNKNNEETGTYSLSADKPVIKKKMKSTPGSSVSANDYLSGTEVLPASFSSSNENVATVDDKGTVTILKNGTAKITAFFGTGSGSAKYTMKLKVKT